LSRTRGILVLQEREADRREREAEAARNERKRAPLRPLRSEPVEMTEEEIQRAMAEYKAGVGAT
jgi:hypothetical protein